MNINGYQFQNEEDMDIAREELNKIQYISDKMTDNPEAVLQVYNKMIESKIFITPLGMEYLRQVQGYLLRSPQIPDEQVADIPVMISYYDALHPKAEQTVAPAVKVVEDESDYSKFKRKYKFSIFAIVILVLMVVAMFIISFTAKTPNIINYRYEIENEYSDWAQQLNEKEQKLREWENELNNR